MDLADNRAGYQMQTYEIDGARFSTLEGFYDEIGSALVSGQYWGRNLNAFNDILCWPVLAPGQKYRLIWRNAALSRQRLNHAETARQLHLILQRCHSSAVEDLTIKARLAERGEGPTVFDWLLEIIQDNAEYVDLVLK